MNDIIHNPVQIIDPIGQTKWNEFILSHKKSSFFHSSNWAQVLSQTYKYTPQYFLIAHNNILSALIPLMEVDSRITGKRGVSLPFTDYCEPIAFDENQFQDIFQKMIEYGKRSGWKYIEMRPGSLLPGNMKCSSFCFGHMLDLSYGPEQTFTRFRDSTKRNIKRARGSGVQVTISNTHKSIEEFYRLNCITRKVHGLPPQPHTFFEMVHLYILKENLGMVALASYQGENIAGAVCFNFGDNAMYKYGASDMSYQHLRANNLVLWEAIQWYCKRGYKTFHLGRTEPENAGLLQFKRGWGAKEYQINYYKYDLRKDAFITDSLNVSGTHNSFFRRMPMPLLKMAGTILYRHMG